MKISSALVYMSALAATAKAADLPGPSSYTAPAQFPSSVFGSFYIPASPTQEPQPAVVDHVLNTTYALNLTNPTSIPTVDNDPVALPTPATNLSSSEAPGFVSLLTSRIEAIIADTTASNCTKCISALNVAQIAAQTVPSLVPGMLVGLCQKYAYSSNSTCTNNYANTSYGGVLTQVLAFADVAGLDGQYICNYLSSSYCPAPVTTKLNTTSLFPKPKPTNITVPAASGNRVKVLHLSDFHLDPRYEYGSEANCSSSLCCRSNVKNAVSSSVVFPAPLYGAFTCDTPYYLALASLQAIPQLTGTNTLNESFAWTVYTGDLVAHDTQNQLSRAYVEYTEASVYSMFKQYIGGPIYAVLGNHDTNPEAIDAPHSLPGPLGQQFSYNYNHVASLWENFGWINSTGADQARAHYGGYSVKNSFGLRIITLNTDFWYKSNFLNYINMTNPDVSGMQAWLISELQSAEDNGERVWILGHVLTGWDGTNPLPNPTDMFYQIVDRYSPHVIANTFWGHTHEDQFMIYYANNGTVQNSSTAQTVGWIGPSLTPLTNLNSGFRMYEVDTGNFEIYESYTWFANVSSFSMLNASASGPVFQYEYSARETYSTPSNQTWPSDAPLNSTYWHLVTEQMQNNHSVVTQHTTFQGKSSVQTPNCTSDNCVNAKICYMRSGSAPLAKACIPGFGSAQSPFTGTA
jgi:hypothetical protein